MKRLRSVLSFFLTICVAYQPAFADGRAVDAEWRSGAAHIMTYPGNHGFIHETGAHVSAGWMVRYRMDPPGYFIRGRVTGGEALAPGTYEYIFYFALQAGSLGGLLAKANDVARIEVWDRTQHERLLYRTFQMADFPDARRRVTKSLVFSTYGREKSRFEPRIYWSGLSSLFLEKVEVRRLERVSAPSLEAKAQILERSMEDLHLRRGLVVTRRTNGAEDDVGDAAIWTGLYAASQAWRFESTKDPKALQLMEASLWALHRLHLWSPTPGTLVRYLATDGHPLKNPASKDTYTGFFFALSQCLPHVKNGKLRTALQRDLETIAGHFLAHDLAFAPAGAPPLEFSPYPSERVVKEGLQLMSRHGRMRADWIRSLQAMQWYFRLQGQKPWPALPRLIRALQKNDSAALTRELIPALNGAREAIRQLQRNVARTDLAYRVFVPKDPEQALSFPEAPYAKLNRVLMRVLLNLDHSLGKEPIRRASDLRILPSQALHALHFLKVAAENLPKPNRFDDYYRANLWEHQALLQTVIDWKNIDDEATSAMFGHSRAASMRHATQHLSNLALFNLSRLEKDPSLREIYRGLFQEEYLQRQEDFNAMLHVMRSVLSLGPDQGGVGLWSLMLYPLNRRGRGEAYWRAHRDRLLARFGGAAGRQALDPVYLDERQRDSFIWQRSARSIRGDDENKIYPPLDFLFVYWLARAHRLL